MDLYPYMFTYGGPQLFVLFAIFVVTPIVYRTILKRYPMRVKVPWILGIWILAIVAAYGDVFLIAREARRLCASEAGMKIYRTIRADGILGPVGLREHQNDGIEYVETATSTGRPYLRKSFKNGQYVEERINSFKSEVELRSVFTSLTSSIARQNDFLLERGTGKTIAEITAFKFYPGWLDQRLLGSLGLSWIPPLCDDNYVPKQGVKSHYWVDLVRGSLNTE